MFKSEKRQRLQSLNLAQNKFKAYGLSVLLLSLSNNSCVPINKLILNNNDVEVSRKGNFAGFQQLSKAIIAMLSCSKFLQHLSLASCGVGKDIMLAIGEGLFKNQKLQVLNLRANRIKINGIKELVRSCFQNAKLPLRQIDLSQN